MCQMCAFFGFKMLCISLYGNFILLKLSGPTNPLSNAKLK